MTARRDTLDTDMTITLTIDDAAADKLPVTIDPGIVSGAPVFAGTRVPVEALLDNLAVGVSLDEFLDNFPSVTRAQAEAVLQFSKETLGRIKRAE